MAAVPLREAGRGLSQTRKADTASQSQARHELAVAAVAYGLYRGSKDRLPALGRALPPLSATAAGTRPDNQKRRTRHRVFFLSTIASSRQQPLKASQKVARPTRGAPLSLSASHSRSLACSAPPPAPPRPAPPRAPSSGSRGGGTCRGTRGPSSTCAAAPPCAPHRTLAPLVSQPRSSHFSGESVPPCPKATTSESATRPKLLVHGTRRLAAPKSTPSALSETPCAVLRRTPCVVHRYRRAPLASCAATAVRRLRRAPLAPCAACVVHRVRRLHPAVGTGLGPAHSTPIRVRSAQGSRDPCPAHPPRLPCTRPFGRRLGPRGFTCRHDWRRRGLRIRRGLSSRARRGAVSRRRGAVSRRRGGVCVSRRRGSACFTDSKPGPATSVRPPMTSCVAIILFLTA